MRFFCHAALRSLQQSWLTASLTWLLSDVHRYPAVSCSLRCCSLVLLTSSWLQGRVKRASWQRELKTLPAVVSTEGGWRWTFEHTVLYSRPLHRRPPSPVSHLVIFRARAHQCVTSKHSYYRRGSQGPHTHRKQWIMINLGFDPWPLFAHPLWVFAFFGCLCLSLLAFFFEFPLIVGAAD